MTNEEFVKSLDLVACELPEGDLTEYEDTRSAS